MIERLEAIDQKLFLFLNGFHSETMDTVMWLFSEKFFWIPAYIIILYGAYRLYGWRALGMFVLGIALTVFFCDRISVELFKEVFQRYRPCHNVDMQGLVHTVEKCGGIYGFVSSHAANYFGVAVFSALWLKKRWMVWSLLIWAALIAYSRVYLGVHYPADIACGGLLGAGLGFAADRIIHAVSKLIWPNAVLKTERS